jgi:hypothetical protein
MRYVRRFSVPSRWRAGALPLCAALLFGCHGEVGSTGDGTSYTETPICDASDPTNVVSPQRIALLTSTQLMNMIRTVSTDPMVGNTVAQMVIDGALFPVVTDLTVRFPPPRVEQYKSILDVETLAPFNNTAAKVGDYVTQNFATVTKCATPATDSCATDYLNKLAIRAYRRQLTTDEQTRFTNLYSSLKSQIVNGYQVTQTVEQATGFAVNALYMSPQLLWRWELGGATSTSPPGVYLTDGELASQLSFFLTDQPPDAMILADAQAGTLRNNIGAHVDRILQQQTSRNWLRHIMEMYFLLNQLPAGNQVDPDKFPIVAGGAVYPDLEKEAQLFLDETLWNGKVMDLLTSRKTFLNSNLASMIYNVPVPAGATPTNFVATELPADQRSGILTNAGFITTRARPTYVSIVSRGLGVEALFLCVVPPSPPTTGAIADQIATATTNISMQTGQEQVAFRSMTAPCNGCHPGFDPYGLVLDWYDVVGRYRMTDDLGKPVDGHTTLPAMVGGQTVQSAVELANVLSKSDTFTNCMASTVLKYALLDAPVEVPFPLQQKKGCAAAGIAHNLRHSSKQSFADLTRAVATSPAFVLRQQMN